MHQSEVNFPAASPRIAGACPFGGPAPRHEAGFEEAADALQMAWDCLPREVVFRPLDAFCIGLCAWKTKRRAEDNLDLCAVFTQGLDLAEELRDEESRFSGASPSESAEARCRRIEDRLDIVLKPAVLREIDRFTSHPKSPAGMVLILRACANQAPVTIIGH